LTDASELRLLLRDLAASLRRLPPDQRSAVILIGVEVEGKSYGEAAETMGTTIAAVRCHLARGRDRLRTAVRGADARRAFAPSHLLHVGNGTHNRAQYPVT
jgi:DNA-directed RNA polymerase specialized sigma24 family protein